MAIPDEVKAAVEHLNADSNTPFDNLAPGQLLDFKIYTDRVVVIIPTGQKYTVSSAALLERVKRLVGRNKSGLPETTLKQ